MFCGWRSENREAQKAEGSKQKEPGKPAKGGGLPASRVKNINTFLPRTQTMVNDRPCFRIRFLFLILLLPLFSVAAQTNMERKTEVILLGSGTPYPDPNAAGPATAVVVGKRVFLFDAGSNVMRGMNAAGLPISGPEAVFITHLHSDHTFGYADLILTSWMMRRVSPLQVYGPHGLQRMTRHFLEAYAQDIYVRTYGLEREIAGGYRVNVHEIKPGLVYERDGVLIRAIPVPHGSWKEAYGYRIDTPDRSIVISGDTRPSEALVRASEGVDVLVHEVYSPLHVAPENRPGGKFWPQYMREFHTSDVELGSIASRAKPKLLVLTHIIRSGSSDADLVEGVRAGGYTGAIQIGKDLARY
jgi:ribonuclease Z